MRRMEEWISELVVLDTPVERVVTLKHVTTDEGIFVAFATLNEPLEGFVRVQVGWLHGCNDFPEMGQSWQVRVLGFDVPTHTWIAQALIRES